MTRAEELAKSTIHKMVELGETSTNKTAQEDAQAIFDFVVSTIKQREQEVREECAVLLETMAPNMAKHGNPLELHPFGKNSEDSAQMRYAKAIREMGDK